MPKKLTYKFVKEQFEKEEYQLLSKEYINANTKLDYICPIGHKHSIAWAHWQSGKRCKYCGIKRSNDSKRLDPNFVRDQFEKKGYKLLSIYKDSKTKLEYLCPNGHYYKASWNNWYRQGGICPICSNRMPTDINFVRESFEKEGYRLLSDNYINNEQYMDYVCPEGHRHSIEWRHWRNSGARCPYCAGNVRLGIDYVRKSFEKEGYILLSKKYLNAFQKLFYIKSLLNQKLKKN